ncbi:hypothetical protein V6N11_044887 [Hibiscus sabdariffa]|uniref:Uncharacterized protein n=1 Tax=Hibiscus sabdariffa TaxID=183260 RepID=A0ABR2PUY6_9ROSI
MGYLRIASVLFLLVVLIASRRSFPVASRSDLSMLERGLHGLEPVVVANFPTKKYSDACFSASEDAQCIVCLSEYHANDILLQPFDIISARDDMAFHQEMEAARWTRVWKIVGEMDRKPWRTYPQPQQLKMMRPALKTQKQACRKPFNLLNYHDFQQSLSVG